MKCGVFLYQILYIECLVDCSEVTGEYFFSGAHVRALLAKTTIIAAPDLVKAFLVGFEGLGKECV